MMIRIPLGLGVLLLSPLLSIAVEVSTGAPNVLFIAVDDWKPEVGNRGSAQIKTRDARRAEPESAAVPPPIPQSE